MVKPKKPVDINKYMSWVLIQETVTTHPLFDNIQEVIDQNGGEEKIIGIDTGLAWYQIYRTRKDWKNSDRVVKIINDMGYNPAFFGNRYAAVLPVWIQKANRDIMI